jgi:hypothetical protein
MDGNVKFSKHVRGYEEDDPESLSLNEQKDE